MNMRPENRCPGSGLGGFWQPTLDATYRAAVAAACPRCHRPGIRVRVTGALYEHSQRGRR